MSFFQWRGELKKDGGVPGGGMQWKGNKGSRRKKGGDIFGRGQKGTKLSPLDREGPSHQGGVKRRYGHGAKPGGMAPTWGEKVAHSHRQ